MLFSAEGLATVTEWLETNWYIPAAAGVGFIIMMVSDNDISYLSTMSYCILFCILYNVLVYCKRAIFEAEIIDVLQSSYSHCY